MHRLLNEKQILRLFPEKKSARPIQEYSLRSLLIKNMENLYTLVGSGCALKTT